MLTLPRLSRMLDFEDDDDYFLFPRQVLWPSRNQECSRGNRLGVPFTANNKYNLHLDLHNFEPKDISVKMDNGTIHVNAKYEKNDEGHRVFREYSHAFSVPDNVVSQQMKCKMTPRGVLQIDAPLKDADSSTGHDIPIEIVKK